MNAPVVVATLGNAAVAIATYAYYGVNDIGALVAARNTARFSALVFLAYFVARSGSVQRVRANYVTYAFAFLAAHYVHFTTIIARHFISRFTLAQALPRLPIWLVGLSLVTITAISAGRWKRTNAIFTYLVWMAFMIAFVCNLSKRLLPEAPLVLLLTVAMLIHLANALRNRKISASSASA
jgi:hypothetical protein